MPVKLTEIRSVGLASPKGFNVVIAVGRWYAGERYCEEYTNLIES